MGMHPCFWPACLKTKQGHMLNGAQRRGALDCMPLCVYTHTGGHTLQHALRTCFTAAALVALSDGGAPPWLSIWNWFPSRSSSCEVAKAGDQYTQSPAAL